MPRIPGIARKDASPVLKLMYRYSVRRFGAVPEPFTVMAHHRRLLMASSKHEMAVQKAARVLTANVRDVAVYRTAQQVGCAWCVDFGAMMQRLQGLDIERLQDIDRFETSAAYDDEERMAIRYADAMTSNPMRVTDEQVAELELAFGRAGVVELTYMIGLENLRARSNHALGITDQGFTSGDACRVPARADGEAATSA